MYEERLTHGVAGMKDAVTAILIWAIVLGIGLALVLFLNWGLDGYESAGHCNLSDGSCYP